MPFNKTDEHLDLVQILHLSNLENTMTLPVCLCLNEPLPMQMKTRSLLPVFFKGTEHYGQGIN